MTTIQEPERFSLKANEPITTVKDLSDYLWWAAQVEMAAIPMYLYASYSIKTQNVSQWEPGPGAFRILKSVVIEEMLHLSLVRNMITAIGQQIHFCNESFIPKYPFHVPMRQPSLNLTLGQLTKKLVMDVFMEFEKPSKPKGGRVEEQIKAVGSEEYETIGQFYKAIYDGFKYLCGVDEAHPNGNPAKERELFRCSQLDLQYAYSYWNEGGGGYPLLVKDLPSALTAINMIVEQGEGMSSDHQQVPIRPNKPKAGHFEYPHYVKLQRIAQGWEPIGDTYTVPSNPKVEDYPEGKIKNLGLLCNAAYTYILRLLDELYSTSGKEVEPGKNNLRYGLERKFIAAMQGLLFGVANQLVQVSIARGANWGINAAPTFEWYGDFPSGKPMTDHLKTLCNTVVPDFPTLGGDNSALWLIGKMPPLTPYT